MLTLHPFQEAHKTSDLILPSFFLDVVKYNLHVLAKPVEQLEFL